MPEGNIKKLSLDGGFGFIVAEGCDVYFHHSVVKDGQFDELEEGQAVEYRITTEKPSRRDRNREEERSPRAAYVKPVSTWR